jgi:hypothetical protein
MAMEQQNRRSLAADPYPQRTLAHIHPLKHEPIEHSVTPPRLPTLTMPGAGSFHTRSTGRGRSRHRYEALLADSLRVFGPDHSDPDVEAGDRIPLWVEEHVIGAPHRAAE